MSWSEFYLIVSGLMTFVALCIAFPWLRRKNHAQADSISNTQIVKQRLNELERETNEGLLLESDKQSAIKELKLALVDESEFSSTAKGGASIPIIVGALIAFGTGIVLYLNVNQLTPMSRGQGAIEALPTLSAQLASGGSDLTAEDISNLTLAIRQRLRDNPEDDQGWMYLGRLWMSVGQDQQAMEAMDKALALSPDNDSYKIMLAQVLMTSGDITVMERAQQLLMELLVGQPENDNLNLMTAVVSAQLGDLASTELHFERVKDKLPDGNEVKERLRSRIAEMSGSTAALMPAELASDNNNEPVVKTGITIVVDIDPSIEDDLPESGYLIVFAQDAQTDNRMPAAVVKMPLQVFPVSVMLNTDNAMLPQFTLDTLSVAKLTARISIDENVVAASGDFEGSVELDLISNTVVDTNILINREIP